MNTNIAQTHAETLQQLDIADIEIATLKKQLSCEGEKHLVSEGLLIEANKELRSQADKLAQALRGIDAALTENELGRIRFGDAIHRIREATDKTLAEYEAPNQENPNMKTDNSSQPGEIPNWKGAFSYVRIRNNHVALFSDGWAVSFADDLRVWRRGFRNLAAAKRSLTAAYKRLAKIGKTNNHKTS